MDNFLFVCLFVFVSLFVPECFCKHISLSFSLCCFCGAMIWLCACCRWAGGEKCGEIPHWAGSCTGYLWHLWQLSKQSGRQSGTCVGLVDQSLGSEGTQPAIWLHWQGRVILSVLCANLWCINFWFYVLLLRFYYMLLFVILCVTLCYLLWVFVLLQSGFCESVAVRFIGKKYQFYWKVLCI